MALYSHITGTEFSKEPEIKKKFLSHEIFLANSMATNKVRSHEKNLTAQLLSELQETAEDQF
jgi:hypothetical protein